MAQVVSDTNDESTPLMPIHARYRWFYPIDWPQLSAVIRFRRAQGKCEGCGRPHGRVVCHLAMGAGGIARRSSGATDEADHCGSYPRCGCGGLSYPGQARPGAAQARP